MTLVELSVIINIPFRKHSLHVVAEVSNLQIIKFEV